MLRRRHVLAGGVGLAAVTGLGALAFGHRPTADDLDSPFLGAQPRATLEAAFEVLLPDPAQAALLAGEVDAFLATDDPAVAEQLPVALLVLEHSVGLRGFHRLPEARRRAVMTAWEDSRLLLRRQIFQALRRTAVMSFFAHPSNWAGMGYDGPLVGR